MPYGASRRSAIAPFIVMDVLRAATARDRVAADPGARSIHLEIGQPGGSAPEAVLAAAARALREDRLGYTDAFGLPALRSRIATHYRQTYGVEVPAERIVLTTGSSGAFILAFLAAFDTGARVAVAEPGYPAYRNILAALGVDAVGLPCDAGDRFQPTIARLEAAGRLDGLIVASPANPTGTMLSATELGTLAAWCGRNGVRMVSDEIYHGIVYGAPAATMAGWPDAIVINSFSKYFAMTGWRLGWMVVPPDLIRAVEVLAQNLFISPPSLPQHAALAAFDCPADLEARVALYRDNRDLLLAELPGFRARGWGILSLLRHRASDERQRGILPSHAGRGGRGGDAGDRFRSRPRGSPCPFFIRRPARRHRTGLCAVAPLAGGRLRRT
jgi:aspartate/methionine/tyrosine aminotransferase